MEGVNALRGLVGGTIRGHWLSLEAFSDVVKVEFDKAGFVLDDAKKLAAAFTEMKMADFIEHHPDDFNLVRVAEVWYDSV
jgi:hypothetical protein